MGNYFTVGYGKTSGSDCVQGPRHALSARTARLEQPTPLRAHDLAEVSCVLSLRAADPNPRRSLPSSRQRNTPDWDGARPVGSRSRGANAQATLSNEKWEAECAG